MKSAQDTGVHLPIRPVICWSQTCTVTLRHPRLITSDGSELNSFKCYNVEYTCINAT